MWNFYTVLLQIHSGNCLQKIGILDLSLIKLLQNEQGCNLFASNCSVELELVPYQSFFIVCIARINDKFSADLVNFGCKQHLVARQNLTEWRPVLHVTMCLLIKFTVLQKNFVRHFCRHSMHGLRNFCCRITLFSQELQSFWFWNYFDVHVRIGTVNGLSTRRLHAVFISINGHVLRIT